MGYLINSKIAKRVQGESQTCVFVSQGPAY